MKILPLFSAALLVSATGVMNVIVPAASRQKEGT